MNAAGRDKLNFWERGGYLEHQASLPGTSWADLRHLSLSCPAVYFYNYHNSSCTVLLFIMWILPLVGYLGVIVGFAFLTLAIGK